MATTGPQMFELTGHSKTVTKEWIARITETVHPPFHVTLSHLSYTEWPIHCGIPVNSFYFLTPTSHHGFCRSRSSGTTTRTGRRSSSSTSRRRKNKKLGHRQPRRRSHHQAHRQSPMTRMWYVEHHHDVAGQLLMSWLFQGVMTVDEMLQQMERNNAANREIYKRLMGQLKDGTPASSGTDEPSISTAHRSSRRTSRFANRVGRRPVRKRSSASQPADSDLQGPSKDSMSSPSPALRRIQQELDEESEYSSELSTAYSAMLTCASRFGHRE